MCVKTITIDPNANGASPRVRLARVPQANVWHYVGRQMAELMDDDNACWADLNCATETAAINLAKKTEGRSVTVDVVIDPVVPPVEVGMGRLVSLIERIAENASAAVEPGPGKVILKSWWNGKMAGVDAISVNASIPAEILRHLTDPGFSTRAGEWDTGFGLHAAIEGARALNGMVELFDAIEEHGVGFRLSLPVERAGQKEGKEAVVGLDDTSLAQLNKNNSQSWDNWIFPAIADRERGTLYVGIETTYRA